MIDSRLSPLARPTARTADGWPILAGEFAVRTCRAGRNGLQRRPHRGLERRTGEHHRCRERQALAVEIFVQLAADLRQHGMLAGEDARLQTALQNFECALEPAAIDEIEEMQAAVVGKRQHGAERCLEPLRMQHVELARARRRGAHDAREGRAESAGGFESLVQLRVEHGSSFPDVRERDAHAPCAVIRLKCHPAIALELPPRGRRIDAHAGEFGIAVASSRLAFDRQQELRDQRRRLASPIQRAALHARPVARVQGLAGCGEELDVLALRRAGAAGRAAEDACRAHAEPEHAFVGRIMALVRAEHRRGCGKVRHGSHSSHARMCMPPESGHAIR